MTTSQLKPDTIQKLSVFQLLLPNMDAVSLLYTLALVATVGASPKISPSSVTLAGQNKAIVPTASGQIGINPVTLGFGDPSAFFAPIENTDSKYIILTESTTKVSPNCNTGDQISEVTKNSGSE
jgi:hypothetical protein